jgi:hypothetical protein
MGQMLSVSISKIVHGIALFAEDPVGNVDDGNGSSGRSYRGGSEAINVGPKLSTSWLSSPIASRLVRFRGNSLNSRNCSLAECFLRSLHLKGSKPFIEGIL